MAPITSNQLLPRVRPNALAAGPEPAAEATPDEIAALLAGDDAATLEAEKRRMDEEVAKAFDADLSERFRKAREARREIEKEMRKSMFRREGKYLPEVRAKLAKLRGNRNANNITEHKCGAAEANILKVLFSPTRSWGLEATPIKELSPGAKSEVEEAVAREFGPIREALEQEFEALVEEEREAAMAGFPETPEQAGARADIEGRLVELQEQERQLRDQTETAIREKAKQEADERSEKMQELIDDQLAEGGYERAMREMVCDFCTYEIAGLMGPIPRREREQVVVQDDAGVYAVAYRDTVKPAFVRLDPWGIYPAALANDVADGDFFYRQLIGDDAAVELFGAENMLKDRLSEAYRHKGSRLDDDTASRAQAEEVKRATDPTGEATSGDGMHELIWWWHRMTRREAAGISREVLQSDADPEERLGYMGLMLNGMVVSISPNWDPSGRPQVHLCSYRRRSGSLFGRSLPWLNKDAQNVRNIAIRGLLTNLLYSASPTFTAHMDLLENPNDILAIYPGKVFQAKPGAPGDNRRAIEPLQVPNFTNAMLALANQAGVWGDDSTGIYPAAYGDARQQGAAETMGGYRMIREDQNIMLQLALQNINDAQQSLIRAMWLWNMLTPGHEERRGDQHVVTRGVMQLYINNENIAACTEKLQFFDEHETAKQLMKPDGYLKLLRTWMTLSNQEPGEYLVSAQELAEKIAKAEAQAQAEAEAQARAEEEARLAEEPPPEEPGAEQPPPAKPESESDRIRAEADLRRAQAAERKAEVEEGKLALARAREASRIREMSQEMRRRRAEVPKIAEGEE